MKLASEFIRLPLRFDAARMALEVGQVPAGSWMAHPDKADGNAALPLISSAGGNNNDFRGEMLPTPHLARCPYLQQVIASFGEVFGRSRLMLLEAGAEVSPHIDYNHHWHNHVRIHIPVITNPDVRFYCADAQLHMQAGECWLFDSWRLHRVVNGGTQARVHLVIDTAGSARFWEMVERAESAARHNTPLDEQFISHVPGLAVQIVTERFNLQPVMSPGEVDGLTMDLIADFEAEPANDPAAVALYRKHLLGFCRDWRALWYQHGIQASGWRHYAALIETTSRTLPEPSPALLVQGGACRVRPVFLTKILGAALAPDMYAQFVGAALRPPAAAVLPLERAAPAAAEPGPGAAGPAAPSAEDPGRNARCHCGSGLRYKHCHGRA